MSADVDSLIAALTDERDNTVRTFSFTAAFTAGLAKRNQGSSNRSSSKAQNWPEWTYTGKAEEKQVWSQNWMIKGRGQYWRRQAECWHGDYQLGVTVNSSLQNHLGEFNNYQLDSPTWSTFVLMITVMFVLLFFHFVLSFQTQTD